MELGDFAHPRKCQLEATLVACHVYAACAGDSPVANNATVVCLAQEACPPGATCDGTTATACLAPKYVNNNVCKVCPAGAVCDGTKATCASNTKYVDGNNACTACPSGFTCDGAAATPCAKFCDGKTLGDLKNIYMS